jgi:integrase
VFSAWYQPIAQTAYYTGMRRGELLGLTRKQVNLGTRIIRLGDRDTKEGKSKRVPIHRELVPILEQCMKVASLGTDKVFLIQDKAGSRAPSVDSIKNPWRRLVPRLGFDPVPHFHDLRHTWKTNARRSRMDPEIRESILGHWLREKSVTERYGRISDKELVEAVDLLTFDHGETEIYAVR